MSRTRNLRIKLLPYNNGSRTAKVLSRALNIQRIKRENSRYIPRASDVILNWGSSEIPFDLSTGCPTFINDPGCVGNAIDKQRTFEILQEANVTIPTWTADRERAQRWLDRGKVVMERSLTRASGGRGLRVLEGGAVSTQGRLWTMYRKKYDEYRVHVFQGNVIDVQQKMRSRSDERWRGETRIRNTANGWVFGRTGVVCPQAVQTSSTAALGAVGLEFAAVDIGYTRQPELATVYEVNTAPSLTGTTLSAYVTALLQALAGVSLPR